MPHVKDLDAPTVADKMKDQVRHALSKVYTSIKACELCGAPFATFRWRGGLYCSRAHAATARAGHE